MQDLPCSQAGNFPLQLHWAFAAFTLTQHGLTGPSKGAATRAGTGSLVREGNSANHLELSRQFCAQSCFWCLELFPKWLPNVEPAVWLTKWLNVPVQLEEYPEHFSEQTASTVLLIIMIHQGRCLNTGGKWERASAPSYIIFSSYSPLACPQLCIVAMHLVRRKPLAFLSHKKIQTQCTCKSVKQ